MGLLAISDIVALAKQGYKPADIKELLEINAEQAPEQVPELTPEPTPEPISEPETEPVAATAPKESAQPASDEVGELKAKIIELQQQIIKKDSTGNIKDPQEDLNELVRAYM